MWQQLLTSLAEDSSLLTMTTGLSRFQLDFKMELAIIVFVQQTDGFWCHEESPLIHPVGWARR